MELYYLIISFVLVLLSVWRCVCYMEITIDFIEVPKVLVSWGKTIARACSTKDYKFAYKVRKKKWTQREVKEKEERIIKTNNILTKLSPATTTKKPKRKIDNNNTEEESSHCGFISFPVIITIFG